MEETVKKKEKKCIFSNCPFKKHKKILVGIIGGIAIIAIGYASFSYLGGNSLTGMLFKGKIINTNNSKENVIKDISSEKEKIDQTTGQKNSKVYLVKADNSVNSSIEDKEKQDGIRSGTRDRADGVAIDTGNSQTQEDSETDSNSSTKENKDGDIINTNHRAADNTVATTTTDESTSYLLRFENDTIYRYAEDNFTVKKLAEQIQNALPEHSDDSTAFTNLYYIDNGQYKMCEIKKIQLLNCDDTVIKSRQGIIMSYKNGKELEMKNNSTERLIYLKKGDEKPSISSEKYEPCQTAAKGEIFATDENGFNELKDEKCKGKIERIYLSSNESSLETIFPSSKIKTQSTQELTNTAIDELKTNNIYMVWVDYKNGSESASSTNENTEAVVNINLNRSSTIIN